MATFFFIRHADHDLLGKTMAGRMPGVHLSELGRRQAEDLKERLKGVPFDVIYCSPLERTQETAGPLAQALGMDVHLADALNEVNFGQWTGMGLDSMHHDENWQLWNSTRSCSRPPGGEMLIEVQTRVVTKLEVLRCLHDGQNVALFTHSDTIRAALAFYLGMPVDFLLRLEVGPASVSVLRFIGTKPIVLRLNDTGNFLECGNL